MIASPNNYGLDSAGRVITREKVRNELFKIAKAMSHYNSEPGMAGEILWAVFGAQLESLGIGREYIIETDSFQLVDRETQQRFEAAFERLGNDKEKASEEDKEAARQAHQAMIEASEPRAGVWK